MQFTYQHLKSCCIFGLCIACLFPGSKRMLSFKAGWLNWCFYMSSHRQHGRGEGGGKEAEVEKRRVVAHLVFISFPCFLIAEAKGPFQPEAMTLLLWYFILEEDGPWCPGVLYHSTAVGWGRLWGAGSFYAAFGTEGSFLRGPKLHLLHKECPSWKSSRLCRYLPCLLLFSFKDVSMETPQANNWKWQFWLL